MFITGSMLFLSQMWIQHTLLMEFSFPIRDHITFVKMMWHFIITLVTWVTTWHKIQISCTFSIFFCVDVMENPGPSINEDAPNRFTCGLCSLDVSRKDRCLCCDNCDRWFHRYCQNLVDIHESPESDCIIGGAAWSCALCGCPNNSTIFSYHTVDVSNRFEQLSDLSSCFSSISSPSAPIAASSPNVNTTESFGCSYNTLSSSNTGSESTLLPSS